MHQKGRLVLKLPLDNRLPLNCGVDSGRVVLQYGIELSVSYLFRNSAHRHIDRIYNNKGEDNRDYPAYRRALCCILLFMISHLYLSLVLEIVLE